MHAQTERCALAVDGLSGRDALRRLPCLRSGAAACCYYTHEGIAMRWQVVAVMRRVCAP